MAYDAPPHLFLSNRVITFSIPTYVAKADMLNRAIFTQIQGDIYEMNE
jgi:hypothetical protein